MADLYTQYFSDDDEEEKQRRAMEALAGADMPAEPAPTPEYDLTPPEPDDQALSALAGDEPQPTAAASPEHAFVDDSENMPKRDDGHNMLDDVDWGPLGGGVGWAVLADLLLNKGKQLPSVLAYGAQAREAKRGNDLKMQAQRSQQTRLQQQDELNAEYRRAQMANIGSENELKRGQQDLTKQSQGLREQEIQQAQADFEERKRKAMAAEQGHYDAEGNALPAMTADEARAAQLDALGKERTNQDTIARERIAAQERIAGMPARARAGGGGGGARTVVDPDTGDEVEELSAGAVRAITEKRRGSLATPIPGTEVVDAPAWQASVQTPAARGQVATLTRGYRQVTDAVDKMIALREQYGTELIDSEAKTAYNLAQKAAIGGYTQIGNSGVLNAGEFQRYADDIPNIGLKPTDALRMFGGDDVTLEQLKGLKSASEASIDAALGTYGLRRGRDASPAIAPEAPAEDLNVLPVTGQRRNEVPKVDDILRKYGARRVQ